MGEKSAAGYPKQVWMAETGDYEQRQVTNVGVSVEAVVDAIQRSYAAYTSSYWVHWEPVRETSFTTSDGQTYPQWTLVGHFEWGTTGHTNEWEITPIDLDGA